MSKGKLQQSGAARSLGQVAKFFGVTIDSAKAWRAGGMPGTPNAWDLSAIAVWLRARGATRGSGEGATLHGQSVEHSYRQARAVREAARAQREQLALQREKGALIALDEHTRRIRRLAHDFAARLERYPAELPARLGGAPVKQLAALLEEYFRRELSELARLAEKLEQEWTA